MGCRAKDGVSGMSPDAAAKGFTDEGGKTIGWAIIDANEDIAFAEAGTLAG